MEFYVFAPEAAPTPGTVRYSMRNLASGYALVPPECAYWSAQQAIDLLWHEPRSAPRQRMIQIELDSIQRWRVKYQFPPFFPPPLI